MCEKVDVLCFVYLQGGVECGKLGTDEKRRMSAGKRT